MSIEKLLSVIIPPCKPQYTGTKQMWDDVEIEMGLIFPADYKNFINIYGHGDILGFFSIASPFGPAIPKTARKYLFLLPAKRNTSH
jgi:hypothetical protein